MNPETETHVPEAFLDAYIAAALWSTSATVSEEDLTLSQFDGSGLEVGDDYNLDQYFGEPDLAPETREAMKADCAGFLAYCEAEGIDPFPEGESLEMSGHDFWLTRNGHGAGYWDRGLGEAGDKLTAAAKTFGEVWLYIGDDGRIYQ